jgi:GH24 family phage-related lysozyme (muramidase)
VIEITPLEIHPEAARLVKLAEELRLAAYLCPAGIPTIGWGHTHGVELWQTCTEEQAEEFFRQDYAAAASAVSFSVSASLTPSMKGALVSLVFNIGAGSFEGSTLLSHLNAREYQLAADEFKRWNKGRHPKSGQLVVLPGLNVRRRDERALFLADGIPDLPAELRRAEP